MIRIKRILPVILLLICLLPLIWPLLQPGFFKSDDGTWMIIRLSAFHETLKTGQFPVRFLERLNHGYGYPVMNFLYPLPFYLGEAIHLLGFNFVDSVKILFILGIVLSALAMYKLAGFAAAVFYVWAPYRIFDVYQRGSLGEATAFIFLPLIFYFLGRNLIVAALTFAALICSHNTIAFIFAPFAVIYSLQKNGWKYTLLFTVLALAVSAWFWLPAIHDLQYTRAALTQVSDFNLYFLTKNNFISLVGILIPLIILLALFRKVNKFSLLLTGISLFFATSLSKIFWEILPLARFAQFPWRFLSLTVFGASILLGILVKRSRKLTILVVITTMITGFSLIKVEPEYYPESFYTTNDDTTTVKNEYMPIWIKNDPVARGDGKHWVFFPGIKGTRDENGFVAGEKLIFKETPLRLFADIISLVSLVVLGILLVI